MTLTVAIRKYLLSDLGLQQVAEELKKLSNKDKQTLADWFNKEKDVLAELKTDKVEYKEVK